MTLRELPPALLLLRVRVEATHTALSGRLYAVSGRDQATFERKLVPPFNLCAHDLPGFRVVVLVVVGVGG